MSLRRILRVALRDIKSSSRDFMTMYVLLAPFLIAGIVMLVIPAQDSISLSYALSSNIDSAIVETFEDYGEVEILDSSDDVRHRVDESDEVIGVIYENNDFTVVIQGNETDEYEQIPIMILNDYFLNPTDVVTVELENIGRETSIVRREISIFLMLFVFCIPGVMVGLNIVEEKEANTISALGVTPLTKGELLIGKSVFGTGIAFVELFALFYIFKYTYVDWGMVTALYIPSVLSGLLIGYIVGAVANDQIAALGMIKFSFFPMMIVMLGTIFIPENWWWTMYWAPYHWMYRMVSGMILENIIWSEFWLYLGLTSATTLFYIIIGKNKALSAIK